MNPREWIESVRKMEEDNIAAWKRLLRNAKRRNDKCAVASCKSHIAFSKRVLDTINNLE